jgi:hypothetical protein
MKITVKAKVTDDSKNKLGKIESEFQNYQVYLQSGCTAIVNLYSATKQQAQRALKKIKQPNPKKQYPVILRRDLVDIQQDIKFEGVYWMKIPINPNSINIRIKTSCKYDLTEYSIRESKILKIQNEWYIFIMPYASYRLFHLYHISLETPNAMETSDRAHLNVQVQLSFCTYFLLYPLVITLQDWSVNYVRKLKCQPCMEAAQK